jgi:predicted alpha/beta superfamily hydrolase
VEIADRYQIRGVPGLAQRRDFDGRRVDIWSPPNPTHILVAHDGQNIHDTRTATRHKTWQLAKSAISVAEELSITPPAIIGIFHSSTKADPFGRIKDLAPQQPFLNDVPVVTGKASSPEFSLEFLRGDSYQELIAQQILPTIASELGVELHRNRTAMIGSSMGGLATLYGVGLYPEIYGSALAFSPHWPIGEYPLVDALINALPEPSILKLWMSRGTKGLDKGYEPFQDYADEVAIKRGWVPEQNFITRIFNRTGHNEKSWAGYVDQALRFWLEG